MYKDLEKQKEANREKARRHRERIKGVTEGVTEDEGVTVASTSEGVTRQQGVTRSGNARVNPQTGKPYGPLMASLPGRTLGEYEHKQRESALVISELDIEQRDYLYHCLSSTYSSRNAG